MVKEEYRIKRSDGWRLHMPKSAIITAGEALELVSGSDEDIVRNSHEYCCESLRGSGTPLEPVRHPHQRARLKKSNAKS